MGCNRGTGDSGTIHHQALLTTTLQCHLSSALLQASLGWNSGIPLPGRLGKSHTHNGWSKLPPKIDEPSTRGVLSWNSALSLILLSNALLPHAVLGTDRQNLLLGLDLRPCASTTLDPNRWSAFWHESALCRAKAGQTAPQDGQTCTGSLTRVEP